MKKIIYIIIVLAVLLLISYVVKHSTPINEPVAIVPVADNAPQASASSAQPAAVSSEHKAQPQQAVDSTAKNSLPAEDSDVVDVQEDIIIDDEHVDDGEQDTLHIEETDPSLTAEDEETLIE